MSAEVLEQVLVKVNGDILTKTELEAKQIAALRSRINSAVDAEAMKNDETLKKMIAEVTPKILVDTIDEMLLLQLGKEKGYHVTDQQFKDWVADIRKDQNLEDEQKFKAALAQEGMTMDDLRRNFERQVTVYRVQQDEVGQKLQITEEEARQYYLAHQSEFVEPATVTLREISIEIPTATKGGQAGINVAQDDAAQKKAEEIRARVIGRRGLRQGRVRGVDGAVEGNGGLIGPIATKELSPAMKDLLTKMKPGEVSQPIRATQELPDLQAREDDDADDPAVRERPRPRRREGVRRPPAERGEAVPRPAPRPGADRLEERRAEEGVRRTAQSRRDVAAAATDPLHHP